MATVHTASASHTSSYSGAYTPDFVRLGQLHAILFEIAQDTYGSLLVRIVVMDGRLAAHIRTLQIGPSRAAGVAWQAVEWEDEGVYDYMKVLVQEAVTLRKVLSRCLPSSVFEDRVRCSTWRPNQDDEDWF